MELAELIAKLEECQQGLDDFGAYGLYMFENDMRHGARIAVQTSNECLPKGTAVYDTSVYTDKVVKNVVIGNVAFFTLLNIDEALEEGVTNVYADMYGALV